MKLVFFCVSFLILNQFRAQASLTSFDSLKDRIRVEQIGDSTYIHFETGAMKGPRITRTEVQGPMAYTGDERERQVVFEYYFIQDLPHSFKTMDRVEVTWKVMTQDWNKWQSLQMYIEDQHNIALTQEDIDLIKSKW
jgi:hypothetical protein